MLNKILAFFPVLLLCLSPSCGKSGSATGSQVAAVDSDSLPDPVKKLVKAVADNDSDGFAAMVSYPLQRPYPLHYIDNADQMRSYYGQLVDDSLKNVISHSHNSMWQESGWRGWSLDDGRYIWVDETVYDVPYISQKEHVMIDSLVREEINSLPVSIRSGWLPALCLLDSVSGDVYRIDRTDGNNGNDDGKPRYRVAKYEGGHRLREVPTELLSGYREVEGTAGTETFVFATKGGRNIYIEPDSPDSGTPVLILHNDSVVRLSRAYWHDLVRTPRQ